MKKKLNESVIYVSSRTYLLLVPFVLIVLATLYFGLKPNNFNQPEVQSFDVSCPTFGLFSDSGDIRIKSGAGYSEGSGMVASVNNPGIFWVHGDEVTPDDKSVIWAMNEEGDMIARYFVPVGPDVVDTEDIDIGPGPAEGINYIYLGDTGDNDSNRNLKNLVRFEEPVIDYSSSEALIPGLTLQAPSIIGISYEKVTGKKNFDVESLFVDPIGKDIYFFTKTLIRNNGIEDVSLVYKLNSEDFPLSETKQSVSLSPVAAIKGKTQSGKGEFGPTSATISADGSKIAVVNRSELFYWERPEGKTVEETLVNSSGLDDSAPACQLQDQTRDPESVAFSDDGSLLYTINEQRDARIYVYQIY